MLLTPNVVGHAASHHLLGPEIPLTIELDDLTFQLLPLLTSGFGLLGELGEQFLPKTFEFVGGQLNLAVEGFDSFFHRIHLQIRKVAAIPSLSSEAKEIRINAAVPALGVDQTQATLAAPTENGALQVVLIEPLLLASLDPGVEQLLNPFERVRINQGFVASVVLDAFVDDDTKVVTLPQQLRELRQTQRTLGSLTTCPSRQTFGGHQVQELSKGKLAGGIELEGFSYQVRSIRIEDHR